MFQIEQSTFLHALGYAIGHSLWQMSLLWLLYFGAIHIFSLTSSKKYLAAVGASLIGLLAFVTTIIYYANHLQIGNEDTDALTMLSAVPDAVSKSENLLFIYNSLLATLRSLSPYLSCAYLVVMLVLSLRLANGFGQVKQLRSKGLSKAPIDWRLFVKQHARFLGIKKNVQLYVSTIASSPLTIGFWKPVILIPLASMNQLSQQQMEAVLLHELAHIRRHDYLLNIILQLAEIALFFNPFMRLLLKQARQERENSCDDWVLQFRYNAADYARALLAIEKQSSQSLLALGTNNKNEFQLLNRVKRMLAPERQSFNYRQQLGLLFLITLLGLGFTIIVPKEKDKQKEVEVIEQKLAYAAPEKTDKPSTPQAVDLIKNFESNIQQIAKAVTKEEVAQTTDKIAETASNVVTTALNNSNINLKLDEVEKKTLKLSTSFEQIPLKDFGLHFETLKDKFDFPVADNVYGQQWLSAVIPALEESAIQLDQLPRGISLGSAATSLWKKKIDEAKAETEKTMAIVRKANRNRSNVSQEELERQQVEISRLQSAMHKLNDSLRLAELKIKKQAYGFQIAMEKAQKEAAIAPFRTGEPTQVHSPKFHYNYQYNSNGSNSSWNQDKNNNTIVITSEPAPRASRAIARKRVENDEDEKDCTCYTRVNQKPKTVVAINGKVLVDRLKEMIENAEHELGEEWTPELQKQVESEIRKELRNLEKLKIKTSVINGSENKKALLIEIETN